MIIYILRGKDRPSVLEFSALLLWAASSIAIKTGPLPCGLDEAALHLHMALTAAFAIAIVRELVRRWL